MKQQSMVILLFCLLYYLQGIPYGIQMKSLPIYYYDVLHYPIDFVTKISLLMSPWILLKPVFAVFVKCEKTASRILLVGIFITALLYVFMYLIFSHGGNNAVMLTFLLLFLINSSTVLMDVATDHLAISSAKSVNDLKFFGISNSIQIVAYKFGAMFSGGIMILLGYENMNSMFLILSVLYLTSTIVSFALLSKHINRTQEPTHTSNTSNAIHVSNYLSMFSSKPFVIMMCYILSYKLGEIGSSSIYPLLIIRLGVSRDDVSWLSSLVNEPISICGSLLGGLMWSTYKPAKPVLSLINVLSLIGFLRVLPLLIQMVTLVSNWLPQQYIFLVAGFSTIVMSFFGGLVSTLTFTLMMIVASQAPIEVQATRYAFLSAVEVLGKLLFSSYIGMMTQHFGEYTIYLLFCMLTVLSTMILKFLQIDNIVDNKER